MAEETNSMKRFFSLAPIILCLWSINIFGALYHMPAPGDDIVGNSYTIKINRGDSVTSVRKRYEVSYHELVEANPRINFNRLRKGQTLVIPVQYILPPYRTGIVINIPELRLYYFTPDGKFVYTYPIGLGRFDWRTPTATAKVVKKEVYPTWHVPDSIRDYALQKYDKLLPENIPPGPDNPLGKYALYLSKTGYMIHGTNDPLAVGTYISSGCMRMDDDPIETLYENVTIGTPVHIIHHPNKAGWLNNTLFLETHLPVSGYDDDEPPLSDRRPEEAIEYATKYHPANINWNSVTQVTKSHLGIPQAVGQSSNIE